MNRSESKYFHTACLMDEALISLLLKKEFEYITVKEVCQKAGVNRSTFYLHYEGLSDLLEESGQYLLRTFYQKMESVDDFDVPSEKGGIAKRIRDASLDELYLVTPRYLEPYLSFVRENKRLFAMVLRCGKLFGLDKTYRFLYESIFDPILDKYHQPDGVKGYLVSFYINGLMAIVSEWILRDCKESIPDIISVMKLCMNK